MAMTWSIAKRKRRFGVGFLALCSSSNAKCNAFQSPTHVFSMDAENNDLTTCSLKGTAWRLHAHHSHVSKAFEQWGVDFDPPQRMPEFPSTCDDVAQHAFQAIQSTLFGQQTLDPNAMSNAMRRSVLDHRPVHNAQGRDSGRMGIEIDGARHLLGRDTPPLPSFLRDGEGRPIRASAQDAEGRAIRRVALMLASKLTQLQKHEDANDDDDGASKKSILVYFNTMQQTLLASQELALLKQEESMKDHRKILHFADDTTTDTKSSYDNVRVMCLGEGIPNECNHRNLKGVGKRKVQNMINAGITDPQRGMVLLVQPSDFNVEARPPTSASGKVYSVQAILAQASAACLPALVLSPRLTEQYAMYERENGRRGGGGFDQSGYQVSATYGGAEPPKGATPWVMRDFTPPIYVWVGCALDLARRRRAGALSILHRLGEAEGVSPENYLSISYHSRVGLMHSVTDIGRPWHIFAALESWQRGEDEKGNSDDGHSSSSFGTTYEFLATTKTSSGRPSSGILKHVYHGWCSGGKHKQQLN